jgi:trans-2,3-dihydro-3-hydroxyanthranilate isomerase
VARRLTWLDVFTSHPLTGNGLAVVHDADGLDEAAMLGFARETNLSETTFVQSATEPGADYRNRIWMPMGEIRFAGHPSLGTAVAVARARGEREASYVQQTKAGLQPIDVQLGDGAAAHASMLQEPAVFGPELDAAFVLGVVGLDAADAHPDLPPQVVATGVEQVIVPVRDESVLVRARPDAVLLSELLTEHRALVAYVVWPDPTGDLAQARAFFVNGDRVLEDPATGSAAGPLCAYLEARTGVTRIEIIQGVAIGRPSRLMAEAGERVRVAGDVVVLADGELLL